MDVWKNFIKNYLTKDIEQNTKTALEAILFLNKDSVHYLSEKNNLKVKIKLDKYKDIKNQERWFSFISEAFNRELINLEEKNSLKLKVEELFESSVTKNNFSSFKTNSYAQAIKSISPEVMELNASINLSDFFMIKLNENLRRVYSAQRSQEKQHVGKMNLSLNALENQQTYILDCLSFLAEKEIKFSKDFFPWDKGLMGVACFTNSSSMMVRCLFHEGLFLSNKEKVIKIIKGLIDVDALDEKFLNHSSVVNLAYKPERMELINTFLEMISLEKVKEVYIHKPINKVTGTFGFNFLNFAINNAESFTDKEKNIVFDLYFSNHIDFPKFKNTIHDMGDFKNKIKKFFESVPQEKIEKNISLLSSHENYECIILELLDKLKDPKLIAKIFKNLQHEVEHPSFKNETSNRLLKKIDTQDEETLLNACNVINKDTYNKKIMNVFLLKMNENLSDRFLADILTLSPQYMDIIHPIYKNRQFKEILIIPNNSLQYSKGKNYANKI